jgi:hypothetical protein
MLLVSVGCKVLCLVVPFSGEELNLIFDAHDLCFLLGDGGSRGRLCDFDFGVCWSDFLGNALFVTIYVGTTFHKLDLGILIRIDGFCLTSNKFDVVHPVVCVTIVNKLIL